MYNQFYFLIFCRLTCDALPVADNAADDLSDDEDDDDDDEDQDAMEADLDKSEVTRSIVSLWLIKLLDRVHRLCEMLSRIESMLRCQSKAKFSVWLNVLETSSEFLKAKFSVWLNVLETSSEFLTVLLVW